MLDLREYFLEGPSIQVEVREKESEYRPRDAYNGSYMLSEEKLSTRFENLASSKTHYSHSLRRSSTRGNMNLTEVRGMISTTL